MVVRLGFTPFQAMIFHQLGYLTNFSNVFVHRHQHASRLRLVADDEEIRGVLALLERHDPLPGVIGGKLDHHGRKRVQIIGSGHAQADFLQGLAIPLCG